MTADTILTKFRDLSKLTDSQFSDTDMTDKAEPYAIETYNDIMDTDYTITSHTTGSDRVNEAVAYICAEFAFRRLFFKRAWSEKNTADEYMQSALRLMNYVDPSKVAYDEHSARFYPRYDKRGKPCFTIRFSEND